MKGALVKSRPLLGIPLLTDIAKVASTARAARSGSSTLVTTARVAEPMQITNSERAGTPSLSALGHDACTNTLSRTESKRILV